MLLTCPSCETRYQVDEAAIDRAAGRQVRCANCGYLWHFAPSLEEHVPAPTAAGPAALSTTLELGSAAAPAVEAMHPALRGLLQVGAALIVAAVILVPILGRNTVVGTWPESAKVYQAVGLQTVAPGTGLDVKVTPLRSDGAFVVTGEITNTTREAVTIPPVRVGLLDMTKREVEFQMVDPPAESLPPGAVIRFKTVFEHPSVAATDVVATFGAE